MRLPAGPAGRPGGPAHAGDPEIVLVRIYDILGARVAVTRGDGKTEIITFESGPGEKGLTAGGQGYYKLINGLYQEGFALQSTFSSSGGAPVTTLVFVKTAKP